MKRVPVDTVLLDIDGVLTDGRMLIGPDGSEWKSISFDDIDAVFALKRAGLKIGFLTGESTPFCEYVRNRFKPDYMVVGCKDKLAAFAELRQTHDLDSSRVAYVGDSRHDISLLRELENSFAPLDAPSGVREAARHVLNARRGAGVVLALAKELGIDG